MRKAKPAPHKRVLLWISNRSVAIEHMPVVGWNTHSDGWWTGIPGNYLSLADLKWKVTHWLAIPALEAEE